MRLGVGSIGRFCARRARTVATALAVLLALCVVAAPAPATAAAPGHDVPAGVWVVTQSPSGHLDVVSGRAAAHLASAGSVDPGAPRVLSVQGDESVHALGYPENDPLRWQQWALDKVSFEPAWLVTRGQGVIVAIIDTGVEADHQDLAGSVLPGVDFVHPGGDGRTDPNGHGTHVAGIIAAHANNGLGIAGAAPGVRILPVRVLDQNGAGVASNVAKGIIWATDHGARVVNVSLGGGPAPGVEQAIQYANSRGAVVVAAAGNNAQTGDAPVYPAAYPEAIAVTAVDSNLGHPDFANTGSYIDVAAPGVGIVSAWGSDSSAYASATGTSMATPFAAAEAALIIAARPSSSAADTTRTLESTARHLGPGGVNSVFGHGLLDPGAAMLALMPHPRGYGSQGNGYWIVGSDGRVHTFGHARFYGDLGGRPLASPIVASARTPDGHGYWLAAADGSVFSFGDAGYHGSMSGRRLSSPIVGMAATPTGRGYILLGADGGIFTFGDAHFYGSTGAMRLNARVLDLAITRSGHGYWFVAGDGGVFTFGDARFHGSTGNLRLAAPVMSMTSSSSGKGYWMVAADGGIFAFNVPFEGSMPAVRALTNAPFVPTVRMRSLSNGSGYYLLGADGSVFTFGTARFYGAAPGTPAVDLMLAA